MYRRTYTREQFEKGEAKPKKGYLAYSAEADPTNSEVIVVTYALKKKQK